MGDTLKILAVCDKGVNRSVHIASLLKFRGHDTIPVGVDTASPETLKMLLGWADMVITTSEAQVEAISDLTRIPFASWVWPMEDHTRPYNGLLYRQTLRYIESYSDKLREA